MALASRLFKGDPRLEACLARDSAHLTRGAQGDFVRKTQKAVVILCETSIDPREIVAGLYGPSTANAVLAYKQARQIINPAYQTRADDIIGKLTIKSLDAEMAKLERGRAGCQHCGDPILGHAPLADARPSRFAATAAGGPVGQPVAAGAGQRVGAGFQLPDVLNIAWQISEIAARRGGRRHVEQVAACNNLLDNLLIAPVGGDLPFVKTFDYPITISGNDHVDVFALRRAAGRARQLDFRLLRVIVHVFVPGAKEFGVTDGGEFDGAFFPNFIVLNAERIRPDKLTLLHEMIHATDLTLVHDDEKNNPLSFPDPTSVFSSNDNRDHIRQPHLDRLSKMPWRQPFPTL
jgi:hypothetical protein